MSTAPAAVDLCRRNDDGSIDVVARFVWDGAGPVRLEAVEPDGDAKARSLVHEAIPGPDFEPLTPADGFVYLQNLSEVVRGSRMWATEPYPLPNN